MADVKKPKTKAAASSNTAAIAVGPSVPPAAPRAVKSAAAKPPSVKSAAESKPAAGTTMRKASAAEPASHQISAEEKAAMIARAAYFRAEARNFAPGHEHEDWLAAEREIEEFLSARHRA